MTINDQGTVLRSFVAEGHKKRGRCSRMVLFSNRFTKPNIYKKILTLRLSSSSERYRAVAHARGRPHGSEGSRNSSDKCLPQDFLPSRFYFAHSSLVLVSNSSFTTTQSIFFEHRKTRKERILNNQ